MFLGLPNEVEFDRDRGLVASRKSMRCKNEHLKDVQKLYVTTLKTGCFLCIRDLRIERP
jgi:hypothetical protein